MFKQAWFIALMMAVALAIALVILIVIENMPPPAAILHVACDATLANSCRGKILVFSKTGAFRHQSIPAAKAALRKLTMEHNVAADFTEDATVFTDANLAQYDAVVFLLTTGEILDGKQQAAFERYIQSGGGYVGIHSASDTEYDWPWYGRLVGAYFDRIHGHSGVVQATVHVIDRNNPSTMMLPALWVRTDEWYNFATNPSGSVRVLMTVDERSYKGGVMGADHPIAWYHAYGGGRAWYTGMGHTSESYSEPLFLAHIWGGIIYAMGERMRSIVLVQHPGQAPSFLACGWLVCAGLAVLACARCSLARGCCPRALRRVLPAHVAASAQAAVCACADCCPARKNVKTSCPAALEWKMLRSARVAPTRYVISNGAWVILEWGNGMLAGGSCRASRRRLCAGLGRRR